MSEKKQYYEDEIDLKELVLNLWKNKKMIIAIALVAAIISVVVTKCFMTPVYDTKLNIIINMPETYTTKYGEFALNMSTNEQYINMIKSNDVIINTIKDMGYDTDEVTVEGMKNSIEIVKDNKDDKNPNSFEIIVGAKTPEESLQKAQTLYKNYISFIDVLAKERATVFFTNQYNVSLDRLNVQLETTKQILSENEKLLSETPETINQRQALDEIGKNSSTLDYVVMEKVLNENYAKIQLDIISNKQSIASIEEDIRTTKGYLDELNKEQEAIDYYYETGDNTTLSSNLFEIVKTYVYMPSEPVIPTQKTSPSTVKNLAIGIVLGGMIGVFAALIKEYWIEN